MRVLGLVAARGGSKGVPRKNIRILGGKPLVAWAVRVGLGSTMVDRVIVSTDDPEIASAARDAGADVPFMRPHELATDEALQIDAVVHALETLASEGDHYEAVALLQPTVPLRTVDDVDGTVELFLKTGADSAITVCEVGIRHPATYYRRGEDGTVVRMLEADSAEVRRQDLPTYYWRTGAVYVAKSEVVLERRSLYGDWSVGYIVPAERSFNIDSEFDWDLTSAWLARHGDRETP